MNVWDWPPRGRRSTRGELDERWGELNRLLVEHARLREWGMYRNVRYAQAEQLRYEDRWKDALSTMMEVNYLDLNGPENLSGPADTRKAWSRSNSFLAPVPLEFVLICVLRLGLGEEQARAEFLERTERVYRSLKTPIPPLKAWDKLRPKWFRNGRAIGIAYG